MQKKMLFMLIVIFFTSSAITSSENITGFNNDRLKYMENLVDTISSKAPINVIIALDSSSSMINSSNKSKEIALDFLNLLEKKNDVRIGIGYVSWSHSLKQYEYPTPSYGLIKEYINNTTFSGNTCFAVGINESMKLLNANRSGEAKKAIVFISDGNERCNISEKSQICSDLDNLRNSGIYLYGISTEETLKNIIPCPDYPISPFSEIETISDQLVSPQFALQAQGREIKIREPNTNVTVTKKIEGGIAGPRIVLTMTVPSAKEIKNAIVLALDSSGSLGLGGRPDQGVIIRKVMPSVLAYIADNYPETNISILSWDNDYDYAYFNLTNPNNSEPKYARLVPIGQAVADLERAHVFNPADDSKRYSLPYPFDKYQYTWPFGATNPNYNGFNYYCREDESTNFSVGVKGAIDILNASYPEGDNDAADIAAKSIILVTGRSEFTNCSPEIIEEAYKNKYRVFPVGLGVIKESILRSHLDDIAIRTNGVYKYSPNNLEWTEAVVRDDIISAIKETTMRTIVGDIVVRESLYRYLNITNIVVKCNGNITTSPFKSNPLTTRKGQTWEMIFKDGLNASDILEIEIETEFNMDLPVDVSEEMTQLNFNPETGTAPSVIKYNWRNMSSSNMSNFTLPLPENRIII